MVNKVKMSRKDTPLDSPGSWDDSVLRLYVKAERPVVERIEKAIRSALACDQGCQEGAKES